MPEDPSKEVNDGAVKGSMSLMVALPPNLQRSSKARAWFGTMGVVLLIVAVVANLVVASGLLTPRGMQIVALVASVGSALSTLFAYWATPPARAPRAPRTPKPKPGPST
jgi:hypothetical protein